MAESYAIVVDLGSYEIKAGFSYAFPSEEEPRLVTPSLVKNNKSIDDSQLIKPIQSGEIKDWDALESLIYYTLYDQLGWVPGGEGSVMMIEPAMTSREDRERLTQLMFEVFNVTSYFATDSAVASMYGIGKNSGIVVDLGYEKTDIIPVLEGMVQPSAACRLPYGGHHLTMYLQELLNKECSSNHVIGITEEIAETIKKECMHVAEDPRCSSSSGGGGGGGGTASEKTTIDDIKKEENKHDTNDHTANNDDNKDDQQNKKELYKTTYTLPDNQTIHVERECRQVGEALLDPCLLGFDLPSLSHTIYTAGLVTTLHGEKDARKILAENILLCGGGSIVPGLAERILKEMKATVHPSLTPAMCQIPAYMPPQTQQRVAWMGGAALAKFIFGGQAQNQAQQAVMKVEYEEYGPCAVHRKCS